jgi:hypothetical protein
MAAVLRLSTTQQSQPVPCRFESDGQLVLEDALPWRAVAVDILAARHLTGHTDQLRSLRSPSADDPA